VTRPKKRKPPAHQSRAQRRPSPASPGPLLQPGRRPSSPGLLLFVAVMWIGAGVVDLVALSASWKLVPGIVFIGLGLLYLRGAAATVARRADDRGH
jgi:hypothetical protein